MRKIIYIFLVFISLSCFAQSDLSKFYKTIATSSSDTAVINAWYNIGASFRGVSLDSIGKYTRIAYNLAKKKNQKKLIVKCNITLSEYHLYKLNIDSVEYHAIEGCRLAREINDKPLYARSVSIYQRIYSRKDIKDSLDKYTSLTVKAWKEAGDTAKLINALIWTNHCYRNAGYIEDALKYTMLALKYSEYLKDSVLIGDANWCMAVLQRSKNDYKTELKYINECVKYLGNRPEKRRRQDYFTEKASIFKELGWKDSVLNCQLQSLQLIRSFGDSLAVFYQVVTLADIYTERGDFKNAENYLLHAVKVQPENNLKYKYIVGSAYYKFYKTKGEEKKAAITVKVMIADVKKMDSPDMTVYSSLSDICFEEKMYAEAKYFLDKCYDSFISYGLKDVYNRLNFQYAVIHSELGNYKEAYNYLWKYTKINDSIYTERSNKSIVELEGKFQNEKKELEIRNLKNEKSLQDSELERQNIQKLFFAIGFVFVLIFAGFAYKAYRSKKKDNQIIILQKNLVEEKQKEIVDSINYAKKLQDAILPPLSLVKQYLPESFILYKPKDIVAGDFYWMHVMNKDHVLIASADCTGHGVPGAMVSVVCSNALNRTVTEFGITEPGKILDKVRELVIETFQKSESEVKDGMDISLCSIKRSERRAQVTWAGANNPLLYFFNGELKEITANKQPIGKYADEKPFTTHSLELNQNDSIYLITDGYSDQFGGPQGKKFKYKQLKELLKEHNPLPMQVQFIQLDKTFENWRSDLEQVDDVCIIGIRI